MSILGELFESTLRQVAPNFANQIYGFEIPTTTKQFQRAQTLPQPDVGIHVLRPVLNISSPVADIAVVK